VSYLQEKEVDQTYSAFVEVVRVIEGTLFSLQAITHSGLDLLVVPALRSPFPWLLAEALPVERLSISDFDEQNISHQLSALKVLVNKGIKSRTLTEVAFVFLGNADSKSLKASFNVAVNPFGAQNHPAKAGTFDKVAYHMLTPSGIYISVDWGPISYPEDLRSIEVFANEESYSRRTVPKAKKQKWDLIKEHVISLAFTHTISELLTRLPEKGRLDLLKLAGSEEETIVIKSSVLVRFYRKSSGAGVGDKRELA